MANFKTKAKILVYNTMFTLPGGERKMSPSSVWKTVPCVLRFSLWGFHSSRRRVKRLKEREWRTTLFFVLFEFFKLKKLVGNLPMCVHVEITPTRSLCSFSLLSAPSLSVSLSLCLSVSLSLCHSVSLSLCHSVSLSLCKSITESHKQ